MIKRFLAWLRVSSPLDVVAPGPIVRIWDKDFNLVWSGTGLPEYLTVDSHGARWSGRIEVRSE